MTHAIHKRRLLAVLTAVFALFALLLMHPTAGAVDEEDELIGANIQDGVLLGYYGPGGDIVLPNTVTKIGDEALKGNKKITGITIPGSVTDIGIMPSRTVPISNGSPSPIRTKQPKTFSSVSARLRTAPV